jgi:hypothetical protein
MTIKLQQGFAPLPHVYHMCKMSNKKKPCPLCLLRLCMWLRIYTRKPEIVRCFGMLASCIDFVLLSPHTNITITPAFMFCVTFGPEHKPFVHPSCITDTFDRLHQLGSRPAIRPFWCLCHDLVFPSCLRDASDDPSISVCLCGFTTAHTHEIFQIPQQAITIFECPI